MHCLVFTDTDLYSFYEGQNLTLQNKNGAVLRVYEINVMT